MEFDSFVLAAATADLGDAALASDHADAVEFRMDLAATPLESLAEYDGPLPVVATNRVDWEGGEAPDTPARIDVLAEAARHEMVEAVDVELAALEGNAQAVGNQRAVDRIVDKQQGVGGPIGDRDDAGGTGSGRGGVAEGDPGRVLEVAAEEDAAVIVSTHDFDATPARDAMADRLERACEYGDVGKLAVTAHGPDDVLDLLGVTHELDSAGHRISTMAMGEAGRHSRAVAPLYGSKIGYAPVDPDDATAPGQYDLATLRGLIEELRSHA